MGGPGGKGGKGGKGKGPKGGDDDGEKPEDYNWDDAEKEAKDGMRKEMRKFFDDDDEADRFADEQFEAHVKPAMDDARKQYGEDGAKEFARDMEDDADGEGPSGDKPSGKGPKGGEGEKPAGKAEEWNSSPRTNYISV